MLIKMFTIEKNAIAFARKHNGKIIIKYDWDDLKNRLIKFYLVKF